MLNSETGATDFSNENQSDEHQRQGLLQYLRDEINRNSDFSKWSGISVLSILVLLAALFKYSYEQISEDSTWSQLLLELATDTFVIFNVIIFIFFIYSYLSGLRKVSPPIKLLSTISEYRIVDETKLELTVAALVLIANSFLVLVAHDLLAARWIVYLSSAWLIVKGSYFLMRVLGRRVALNEFGIVSPNYTWLIATRRTERIRSFVIIVLIELINLWYLACFVELNLTLFSFANTAKTLPIIASIFAMIGLLIFLIKMRIQLKIVTRLRIIEFHVLKFDLGANEILEVLEETYIGRTTREWIDQRFKGFFERLNDYISLEITKVLACRTVLEKKEKNFEKVMGAYLALATFKKYDQLSFLQYMGETIYHLSALEESELLDEIEEYNVKLLNFAVETMAPRVKEIAQEVDEFLEKMSKYLETLVPDATLPVHV